MSHGFFSTTLLRRGFAGQAKERIERKDGFIYAMIIIPMIDHSTLAHELINLPKIRLAADTHVGLRRDTAAISLGPRWVGV